MSEFNATVDARLYLPKDKHRVIFNTLGELESNQIMQLVNDHDPKPLYYQLSAEYPNQYNWEYLEQGPEIWRVKISKNSIG